LSIFTHTPPQGLNFLGLPLQRQVPCPQWDPSAQALPHDPQLSESRKRSTHSPLQSVAGGMQMQ